MRNFYSSADVDNLSKLIDLTRKLKSDPHAFKEIGKNKTLVLLFFNPSLRTRLSTEKAGINLGMQVINMDMKASWAWEFEEKAIMNTDKAEHVKEAARVISSYADIIGIRSFPGLDEKSKDYEDTVIRTFMKHCRKPVVNLESAIRHPLQSLADLFTIEEHKKISRPKIVLSWAPHPRALPQAVSNSFLEWMNHAAYPVTVTHPEGYELEPGFMKGHCIEYDQKKALVDADFVYVKNWSSVSQYGKVINTDPSWIMNLEKMKLTNDARLMHCLPVRRNVVIADDAMDSAHSLIPELAENRLYTAQAVLYSILNHG